MLNFFSVKIIILFFLASGNDSNFHNFYLFAEALGSEGQLAVFQLTNGEECIIRPLR